MTNVISIQTFFDKRAQEQQEEIEDQAQFDLELAQEMTAEALLYLEDQGYNVRINPDDMAYNTMMLLNTFLSIIDTCNNKNNLVVDVSKSLMTIENPQAMMDSYFIGM